jgi:hypothetical protein
MLFALIGINVLTGEVSFSRLLSPLLSGSSLSRLRLKEESSLSLAPLIGLSPWPLETS